MSLLVKICGLANAADAASTLEAGPDAMGFVFWPKSPRAVTPAEVADWTRGWTPGSVLKVGVFVNPSPDEVRAAVETAGLDRVQLHGDEDADFLRGVPVPVWKALHLDRLPDGWADLPAERLLVDSGTVETPGGTGRRVDAARAAAFAAESPRPLLLAGGLNADNVASAVAAVRPDGVDVSSGVEAAPGRKDPDAVRRFIQAARRAANS